MRLPQLPNYGNWLDSAYDFYYNDYLNDTQNEEFEQHPLSINPPRNHIWLLTIVVICAILILGQDIRRS